MMQKPISAADVKHASVVGQATPINVTIVTLDGHMATALDRARIELLRDLPGLRLTLHATTEFADDEGAKARCIADIQRADIIIAHMMFMEDQVNLIAPLLQARRDDCDCIVGCLAAGEIVKMTKLGEFDMAKPTSGVMGMLKKLRGGNSKKPGAGGKGQMRMLRALPGILKFIPGKAQDVRAYFMVLQYLLAASDDNIVNLVRFLVGRYASGPRLELRKAVSEREPVHYPEVGLYHRALPNQVTDDLSVYTKAADFKSGGTVGLLVMRSYVLANNTAHYDGVVKALEAQGLNVITAYASGLDGRPAIEKFFMKDGKARVDCVMSLTGFSLVGGPAYNDASAAEEILAKLDVPYLSAFASEFQSLQKWGANEQGLTPVETTIMVSLPEIDGATGPILFGGRNDGSGACTGCHRNCTFENTIDARDMQSCVERAEMLAARMAKIVALRRTPVAERRVATVLYNFPPNGGATGTAAYLGVFESLLNTLRAMQAEGYTVDVPESVDALREAILEGDANTFGQAANIGARVHVDTHV
ncbi:MAG: cobaltochelatase subunit CobN, partial [Ahrensia sp.]